MFPLIRPWEEELGHCPSYLLGRSGTESGLNSANGSKRKVHAREARMKQRKAVAILCSSALAIAGMFLATASTPSKAAVTSGPFSAFATGTAEHISLVDAP